MLPILQIGPLAIQLPGLILLASVWLGLTYAERHTAQRGIPPDVLYNLAFTAIVAGIVGARLAYAGRYAGAFLQSPAGLISLNPGLLDPAGGVLVALAAAVIYGSRKGLRAWAALDALTPLFAVTAVGIALANAASGSGFGAPTDLPWAVELWGAARHPSQFYEAAAAVAILAALHPDRAGLKSLPEGGIFLRFAVATGFARVFLEAFRGDSQALFLGIRTMQLAAWAAAAVGLFLIYSRGKSGKRDQRSLDLIALGDDPDRDLHDLDPLEQRP